jgi:hypothetical protein
MIKAIFFSLYTLLTIPLSLSDSYEPITFKIDKDTSDEQILVIKDELQEQGIDFSYTITRNEKLEITSLSLELRSKNSRSKNTVGSGGNKPIQPFTIVIDPERGSSMISQGATSKSFNSSFMNMDDMDLSDFDKTIDQMRAQMQAQMARAFSGNNPPYHNPSQPSKTTQLSKYFSIPQLKNNTYTPFQTKSPYTNSLAPYPRKQISIYLTPLPNQVLNCFLNKIITLI